MTKTDLLKTDLLTGAVALGEQALTDLTGGAGASGSDGGSVSSGVASVPVSPVLDGGAVAVTPVAVVAPPAADHVPIAGGVIPVTVDHVVSLREKVFAEAERIVKNVRHTKYQHNEVIDEATGTYECDCSGFVSYVLSRVAKRHLAEIPKESWWPVPRAYKYYQFFAALASGATHGWERVEQLEDARRGDIIAWELPGEIRKDHDTGHVWVVAETPSLIGEGLMAVAAYDSALLKHYDDSRRASDGTFHDGVGEGTFHLKVDAMGKPVAFQFGPGDNFHADPIVIGRILPLGG